MIVLKAPFVALPFTSPAIFIVPSVVPAIVSDSTDEVSPSVPKISPLTSIVPPLAVAVSFAAPPTFRPLELPVVVSTVRVWPDVIAISPLSASMTSPPVVIVASPPPNA